MNVLQTELAEKIGVSKQTLYKYENNIVTNIPSYKIELIAKT
nr:MULTISPECIES: helix-turn-helix transcriptional regulator [Clostridia]